MSRIIGNIASFAFLPVVISYLGVLFYMQRHGKQGELERLVTTIALPVFATLNTLAVVSRPHTTFTRTFSLLWLVVATVCGCWIAMGNLRPSIARVPRHYAIPALILCIAVAARNIVYIVT